MTLPTERTVPIRIRPRYYPVSLDGLRAPEFDPPTEILPVQYVDPPTVKLPVLTVSLLTSLPENPAEPSRTRELLGVLRDIAYVSFGKYGQYLVTVATLPIIARVLGAAGLGLLAIGMSSYFLGSLVVDLGITSFLAARVQETGVRRDSVNRTRGTYLAIRASLLGVLTLALAVGIALRVPEHLHMILLGLFVGGFWSMSEDWVLIGQGRFGASTVYQAVARLAYLGLLLVALPHWPTASVAMLCLLANAAVSVVLTWWDTWRGFGPPARPRGVFAMLRTAAPVVTGRLMTTSYGQGSATVYGSVLDAVSLGLYSASDRLVRAVQSMLDPIGFALLPRMAKRSGEARFWPDAHRALAACVLAACVACAGLWFAAPTIVTLVFGQEFEGAVAVLRLEVLILPATTVTSFVTTAVLPVRQDTVGVLIGAVTGTVVAGIALLLAVRSHSVWTLVGGIVAAEIAVAIWYLARMRGLMARERRAARAAPSPTVSERRTP
ncbi:MULTISPECIES: lipopolysaccharide biosynthesis protein [Nocardia]|uniref:lipopolysaccharide biosynthesis protein n=1 Tax=Nocardia TaxID=1817 RepID=UPI000D698191|nr:MULTISPECIES: lipopolysaccharide biosynthesis protein [Nocardia]